MPNTRKIVTLCALGVAALVGCASQEKKNEAAVQAMPVNCANAKVDLATLQKEKADTMDKIGNGISMVAPIGLVVGLATGTERVKYQVTTGEYNTMIDKKTAEIKQTCGIS